MPPPDDVHTLAGRLATFEHARPVKRQRASSSSSTKRKAASTITWPHKTPTPEALARAGLFYKPSSTCPDNVTCFICERSFDGWEPSDEPANEHFEHSPECGWAQYACISLRLDDSGRQEKDPSSEDMVNARLMTFRGQWPHESKKGWKCKTKKMVDAGWCYDPTPDADDAVTCFYCGLALDGWEPKDEPMEEHRRRSPGCHFFTRLAELDSAATKAPRGKKGRQPRSSKDSRLSTQSRVTRFSEIPSFMSLGEIPAEDESVLTTATTTTVTSMAGKTRAKGKRAAATGKKTKKSNKVDVPPTETPTDLDSRIPDSLRSITPGLSASSPPPAQEAPKTKRTRKGNAGATNAPEVQDSSEIEPRPKKGRPQRSKTAKTKQRLSEDQTQLHSELQAALSSSLIEPKDETTPRGKKRTSEGVEKVDEPQNVIVQEPPIERSPAQPKRTRGKKKKPEEGNTTVLESSTEEITASSTPPKANAKGRKGKKVSQKLRESPLVDRPQEIENATQIYEDVMQDVVMTEAENGEPEQHEQAKVLSQQAVSSPPPPRQPTVSASPQSSDAENQPPSSKVRSAHQQPPILSPTINQAQTVRIPLAIATPAASPSKRNVINGRLVSAFPWQAADLETIFLGSPDKENVDLTDALRTVSSELTSPEKKMSVEEWIKSNASKGEERLRRDCERLVGIFETQGVQALKSLEGIECI